jgi:hypothetical protein
MKILIQALHHKGSGTEKQPVCGSITKKVVCYQVSLANWEWYVSEFQRMGHGEGARQSREAARAAEPSRSSRDRLRLFAFRYVCSITLDPYE